MWVFSFKKAKFYFNYLNAIFQNKKDTRLQNIIASGDMEQLAQIVLNGDGQKLLNVEATEPEIQAFLKNVPNYMVKIYGYKK